MKMKASKSLVIYMPKGYMYYNKMQILSLVLLAGVLSVI